MTDSVRISKLLAQRGLCSRREADLFIQKGWVYIDGQAAVLGQKVSPEAHIRLDEQAQMEVESKVTILLHKPVGYVSAQPEKDYLPAIRLIKPAHRDPQFQGPKFLPQHLTGLAVAGRLDIDSKGLLVFTQDGRLAKKIIGTHSEIEKEYLVRVSGQVTEEILEKLRFGMRLDGYALKPAKIKQLREQLLQIILIEGKKRQIRRMCEDVGLKATELKRVRIGQVKLGKLKEGCWRYLDPKERF